MTYNTIFSGIGMKVFFILSYTITKRGEKKIDNIMQNMI